MRRRNFIAGIISTTAALSVAARAQQPERMRRIGVLMGYAVNDREGQANFAAFQAQAAVATAAVHGSSHRAVKKALGVYKKRVRHNKQRLRRKLGSRTR